MKYNYLQSLLIGLYLMLCVPVSGNAPFYTGASAPTTVEISGLVQLEESLYSPIKNTIIEFWSGEDHVVLGSVQEDVAFSGTHLVDVYSFRVSVEVSSFVDSLQRLNTPLKVRILFPDDGVSAELDDELEEGIELVALDDDDLMIYPYVDLPVAHSPYTMKSQVSDKAMAMYDDALLVVSDNVKFVGVGTAFPEYPLDVNGAMYASGYYYGDGSGFTTFPERGGRDDHYYRLMSQDFKSTVVEVDSDGLIYIGSRVPRVATANLSLFGSFLLEPMPEGKAGSDALVSSKWLWLASPNVLRIGYILDSEYGPNSVGFGYNPKAYANYSMVFGGINNLVDSPYSIVSGGEDNIVNQSWSIILGGRDNQIHANIGVESISAFILGGKENQAKLSGVVLGGKNNEALGLNSVVSGQENIVGGDESIVLSGRNNRISAQNSLAFGSDISIEHSNMMVVSTQEETVSSNANYHIQFDASHGMGINTNQTVPNQLVVSGNVRAQTFIGSGVGLSNVQSTLNIWESKHSDTVLVYPGKFGVGTDVLKESLNVSGSIRLGDARLLDVPEVPGTIRFITPDGSVPGMFEVYTENKGWMPLEIYDENTQYTATKNLVLHTSNNINTFYISTQNATLGNVLKWNGSLWVPENMDMFYESLDPDSTLDLDLSRRKRVALLTTDNVGIGRSPQSSFDVYLSSSKADGQQNKNMLGYFFHEEQQSPLKHRYISVSLDPIHFNFQSQVIGSAALSNYNPSSTQGSGISVDSDVLSFYVNGDGNKVLTMGQDYVRILSSKSDSTFPFYVAGDVKVWNMLFSTDSNSAVMLKNNYNSSVILKQEASGQLYLNAINNIVLEKRDSGDSTQQMLFSKYNGRSAVALGTDSDVRAELDIHNGNIHTGNGEGIQFFDGSHVKQSQIKMDATESDPIQLMSNNELHVSVSSTGNVSFYNQTNPKYDLWIRQHDYQANITRLETGASSAVFPKVSFLNQANTAFYLAMGSQTLDFNMGEASYMTLSSSGNVGLHDVLPSYPLSIGVPMTPTKGILIGHKDNKIRVVDDTLLLESGSQVVVSTNSVEHAMVFHEGKVLVSANAVPNASPVGTTVYVNGSMLVTGNILDVNSHKLFPLSVKPSGGNFASTVNTIVVDESSGLTLSLDALQSKAEVGHPGFVDKIIVGDQTMSASSVDAFTIRSGTAIEIEVSDNNTIVFKDQLKDPDATFQINNDLTVFGRVTANAFTGDASGIIDIPFRWASGNGVVSTDTHVGIATQAVPEYALKVNERIFANGVILNNLNTPLIKSDTGLAINAPTVALNQSVIFKRNNDQTQIQTQTQKMTPTQWRVGTGDPDHTLDIVQEASILKLAGKGVVALGVESKDTLTVSMNDTSVNLDTNNPFYVDDDADTSNGAHLVVDNVNNVNKIGFGVTQGALSQLSGVPGVVINRVFNLKSALSIDSNLNVKLNDMKLVVGGMQIGNESSAMMVLGSVVVGENSLGSAGYDSGSMYIASDLNMDVGGVRDSGIASPLFINGGMYVEGALHVGDLEISNNSIQHKQNAKVIISGKDGVDMSVGSNKISITKEGKVGINTASPESILHVKDSAGSAIVRMVKDSENIAKLAFKKDTNAQGVISTKYQGASSNENTVQFRFGSHDMDPDSGLIVSGKGTGINKTHDGIFNGLQVTGSVDAAGYIIQDKFATNSHTPTPNTYSKGGFSSFGTVPVGTIIMWNKLGNLPSGWFDCDGNHGTPHLNKADKSTYIKGAAQISDTCSNSVPGCAGYIGGSNSVETSPTAHAHLDVDSTTDNNGEHEHYLGSAGSHLAGAEHKSTHNVTELNLGSSTSDSADMNSLFHTTGDLTQADYDNAGTTFIDFAKPYRRDPNGDQDLITRMVVEYGGHPSFFAYGYLDAKNNKNDNMLDTAMSHTHDVDTHKHLSVSSSTFTSEDDTEPEHVVPTNNAHEHQKSDGKEHAHIVVNRPSNTKTIRFIMYKGVE
jgi:hypothetical protein